jgi:gas vesicle protein
MNKSKLIKGVIIGAAVGAVVYTLFATKKGKKFRRMVADKSGDWSDVVKAKFNDLGDTLKQQYGKAKHTGSDMLEKGKRKAEEAKHDPKYAM